MEARLEPTLVSARRATFWTWLFLIGALGFARAQDSGALDPILVRDILPGPDGSLPDDFLAVGGRLYFTAFESIDPVNNELWVTRGDTGSTQLVFDFPGSSNPDELTAIDDTVYFAASDAVRGRELWRTNGAGATLVRDINPGSFASSPRGLKAVGSQLFFTANDGVNGRELWRLDTTSGATNLVADITPGDGSTVFFSNPTAGPNFAAVGDQLFFVADDGVHGRELWRSDGTAAGTRLVRDIQPGAGSGLRFSLEPVVAAPVLDMIALDDDRLLFAADDGTSGGELWSSDGTEAGTFRVRDILPGDFGSEPLDFAALPLAGLVIFTARDGVSGNEIWRSDGTLAGTQLLRDVNPGLASSLPSWLTTIGNEVFFAAREPVAGDELWATDGTTAGTRRVADILPGAGGGAPGKPVRGPDGLAYFTADDGVTGPELWRSDGTAEGTELAADINPGPDGSFPFNRLASTTELVYAQADDGTSGGELWAVPGTNTLLVNSVGDAVDADTSNRRCDTGAMMGEAVECTLRAAIQESNARAERQVIRFAIAPDQARDGVFVIDVANSLPVVTDPVTIDATTQAGYAVGQPVVEIAGPGRDSPIWGFQVIGTDDTIIRGFSIYGVGRNGILIRGGRGHTIEANIVGTNARGAQEPGIGEDGIFVRDSSGNRIGGVGAVPRNVVSRNGLARTAGCGIRVQGGAENRVQGNYVGLDPAGVEARPNGLSGICLFDAPFNTVGGLEPGEANVSSGNQLHGIEISGEPSTGNRILGNTIGLDAAGGAAVPNRRNGISIGSAASGNIIGDGTEEGRNVVSGNLMAGITIDAGIGFNQVDGNWIGLNGAGNAAVPNGAGIEIRDSPRNRIGVIEGNAISGNDGHGVHIIGDPAVENQIQDNLIGTGPDGLAAVPNVFDGVRIEGARGTGVVGNVIANNGGFGVAILGKQDGQPAIDAQGDADNLIADNRIGAAIDGSAAGNGIDGVTVDDSSGNRIGPDNVIRSNGSAGVTIIADTHGAENAITGNEIFGNIALGIDLGRDFLTPNDALDGDDGANALQNHPVITEIVGAPLNLVRGTLASLPNRSYLIEVFANDAADASGSGEGQRFESTVTVTTDNAGEAQFTAGFVRAAFGDCLSATARDAATDDTSEFSPCEVVPPPPPTLAVDFGDAPDSYGTLLAANGARHQVSLGAFLGSNVDADPDGQPGASATADDLDGSSDEDGVLLPEPIETFASLITVEVGVNATGAIDAWIDFDGDGTFGAGDRIFDGEPVIPGVNVLSFVAPEDAVSGPSFARFRFSTAGGLGPLGPAEDGEIEDYTVTIVGPLVFRSGFEGE